MYNPYNQQFNVKRIDDQIKELEAMKQNYQQIQPMNVFNVGSQIEFEAKILNDNESVDEILVQRKTMFFDNKKGKLFIKEINGDIQEYKVELPKSPEQLKIEELERKIKYYEQLNNADNEKQKPHEYDNGNVKSTTKTNGTTISK